MQATVPPSPQEDSLSSALARHQIEVSAEQHDQLEQYARLLWDWNEKLNLTRHTDWEKFVSRDVVDSLWLEKFLDSGERVLDVGTGGGVPGILLAILRPDLEVSLCDSVQKKARVVQDIVERMNLPIRVFAQPVKDVLQQTHFDSLVARAVASMSKILTWVNPYWDSFKQLLLIKGPSWTVERQEAREKGVLRELALRKLASYPLPGTESESVVLALRIRESE